MSLLSLVRVLPLAVLSLATLLGCQSTPRADAPVAGRLQRDSDFPASWRGHWQGTCVAQRPDGWVKTFPMELHIQPLDTPDRWQWKLVYGERDEQDVRDYELVILDAAAGRFLIDEKNSIEIDAYLVGPTLYSPFSLEGSLLTASYTRDDDRLLFEIVIAQLDAGTQTGGEGEIPIVTRYPINVAQQAELTRRR